LGVYAADRPGEVDPISPWDFPVVFFWVNYNDRTQFSRTLESWFILEESSQKGPTFQVREL